MIVKLRGDEVADVQLKIYEPPRFFEAFLRGRSFTEVTDITARICGICPVAYQMSSAHAMEDVCGAEVGGQLRALRRLLYCGEWIESHTLHVYMLHAPDFLGYESAIELARDHPEIVERALRLKKIGNELMTVVGGREVHPINVKVGGFYRAPSEAELAALVPSLEWAREASLETVRLVSGFDFPDLEADYEFVSLSAPGEYPIDEGRIVSSGGLDISVSEWDEHFVEHHVRHSNALHATFRDGRTYMVGPLARYALNRERLSPAALGAAAEAGLEPVVRNPFRSIVVRAVEIVYACDEALRLIGEYRQPEEPAVEVVPRAGVGWGGDRGTARRTRPSLRDRRRRGDSRRQDRSADLAEPGTDRAGSAFLRRREHEAAGRGAPPPLRAGDQKLRPVHLLRDAFPLARGRPILRIVGIGNRWRSDDAAGLEVVRLLRGTVAPDVEVVEQEGEPADLIDVLSGADRVWLVDAVSSGAAVGTVHRVDATDAELPAELFHASTHTLGLAEAVEIGRALGRLPERLVVFGIEGGSFAAGEGLTAEVESAAGQVAVEIREEVERCTNGR